ncbi:MAG: hypothetical protein AAFY26_07690 [Cyanobacteria bacterium J06638_22]
MPKQNRVNPFGELIATPARGTLMGNRGCLHNEAQAVRRPFARKEWIFCVLHYKDKQGKAIKRPIMRPGRYTELFFLDEATALTAGHRPCGYCLRQRFNEFAKRWAAGNPKQADGHAKAPAPLMDTVLHQERLDGASHQKQLHDYRLSEVPNGCMVLLPQEDRQPYLVAQHCLIPWHFEGYGQWVEKPKRLRVQVLTPPSILEAIRAGFQPNVHPSILSSV